MLQHHAYIEVLSTLGLDTPSWNATLAGLGVLNLVDAVRRDRSMIDQDWTGVRVVTESVASIRDGDPVRRPLARIVEQLTGNPLRWSDVNASLFAYGRALDLNGSWKLAVDVFSTVAEIARAERDHELAIEATTAVGGAARRSGDWDRSAEGYAQAAHLADALGDKASGLTVRVGTANTHIARGNVPAAEAIFDEVVAESVAWGLDGVAALALHGSAAVAHLKGRYAEAVNLCYKALKKTTNPTVKDTMMSDLAAAFFELGMHDAARDAYLVVSATSQYQWIRWQATVNLMELSSIVGDESNFDEYADQLRDQALDPRLKSFFLLYYGQGCRRFGREDEAQQYVAQAKQFAADHKIHQVAFEAERELAAGEKRARVELRKSSWTEAIPDDVTQVALVLSQLRQSALASPLQDNWS